MEGAKYLFHIRKKRERDYYRQEQLNPGWTMTDSKHFDTNQRGVNIFLSLSLWFYSPLDLGRFSVS
jgi:hypothetical protein